MADTPIGSVTLVFRDEAQFAHVCAPLTEDRSAAARLGETLLLSRDETAGIDPRRPNGPARWACHEHLPLAEIFELPGGPEGELDIEGLAARVMRVWLGLRRPVIGGHAAVPELALRETRPGHQQPRKLKNGRRYRLASSAHRGARDPRSGARGQLSRPAARPGDGCRRPLQDPALAVRRGAWGSGLAAPAALIGLAEPPHHGPPDHPKTILPWREAGAAVWLVICDSPAPERLGPEALTLTADLFRLAEPGG